jgi:hypothetical protein
LGHDPTPRPHDGRRPYRTARACGKAQRLATSWPRLRCARPVPHCGLEAPQWRNPPLAHNDRQNLDPAVTVLLRPRHPIAGVRALTRPPCGPGRRRRCVSVATLPPRAHRHGAARRPGITDAGGVGGASGPPRAPETHRGSYGPLGSSEDPEGALRTWHELASCWEGFRPSARCRCALARPSSKRSAAAATPSRPSSSTATSTRRSAAPPSTWPSSPSTAATARTAPFRACSSGWASPTRAPACSPRPWPWTSSRPRSCFASTTSRRRPTTTSPAP